MFGVFSLFLAMMTMVLILIYMHMTMLEILQDLYLFQGEGQSHLVVVILDLLTHIL